jgi:hypothetical protein
LRSLSCVFRCPNHVCCTVSIETGVLDSRLYKDGDGERVHAIPLNELLFLEKELPDTDSEDDKTNPAAVPAQ